MTKHTYKRQESWRLKRVKPAWRRPRGGTSRIRLEVSGWPRMPNIGLRSETSTRGLHPSGLRERYVSQERDIEGLDPNKHIVRLAHQLGEKKRLLIIEKIRRLNVRIANPGSFAEAKPAPSGEAEATVGQPTEAGEERGARDGEPEGPSTEDSMATASSTDDSEGER